MKTRFLVLIFFILSLTLSSCSLAAVISPLQNPAVQTSVADSVKRTLVAATLTAIPTVTSFPGTPTPIPPTPTLTFTPFPTFTPTLEGTWLTITEETNCRNGPAVVYAEQSLLPAGTLVEVMARNPENDFYYVRNPSNFAEYCWVWSKYTSLVTKSAYLPVITAFPSPTPLVSITPTFTAANFTVSYDKLLLGCSGNYAIQLYVENTGSIIWRSIRVVLTDTTFQRTFFHSLDIFRGVKANACNIDTDHAQGDLAPGEGSLVACINSGQFNYDPTGHSFTIKVTLYSKDGWSGTSAVKTITLTP